MANAASNLKYSKLSRKQMLAFALFFGLVSGVAIYKSFALSPPPPKSLTFQAESMKLFPDVAEKVSDKTASKGKAVKTIKIGSGGASVGDIKIKNNFTANSLSFVARNSECPADVIILVFAEVNGTNSTIAKITGVGGSTTWKTHVANLTKPLGKGTNYLSVYFSQYEKDNCDPNLFLDKFTLYGS